MILGSLAVLSLRMAPKGRPRQEWLELMRSAAAEATVKLRAEVTILEDAAKLRDCSCECLIVQSNGIDRFPNAFICFSLQTRFDFFAAGVQIIFQIFLCEARHAF